jgi:hypothetical protein
MRAFGRSLTAASIGILAVLGLAGGTAADCTGDSSLFAGAVASAWRVVIGDVVAVVPSKDLRGGRSSQFTIQVTHVVRGDAITRLDMSDETADPCSGDIIVARMGDRVALAFGGTALNRPVQVTGVAWIVGQPNGNFETTSVADVYRLAGVPMPETTVAFDTAEATPSWLGPALWGLGVGLIFVIGAVVARRLVAAR